MINHTGKPRLWVSLVSLLAASVAPLQAQGNPTWLGRPFVKVLAKGDPIPGRDGAAFLAIERFTLRNGTIHIVAGESANRKGLFRWRDGQLTRLVDSNTLAPTGAKFDAVHFTTDETEGALNFVGEVFSGKPGAVFGLFEWRSGVITTIFDGAREVDGKVLLGLGYPVRVGHEVAGATMFYEGGAMKDGVFRWDGATLRTVIQTGDDLPGSLGGFTGHPGRYQIAFDGQNVGFVASADPRGQGPYGVYRAGPDGTITRLVDGTDAFPWGGTYADSGLEFVNVDLDGSWSFVGVGDLVSATGRGNSFYFGASRITGGTLNATVAPWGADGAWEEVLPFYEPGTQNRAKIDGKVWTGATMIDGQGDDVALYVRFDDFSEGIYAAIGATAPPLTPPAISLPAVAKGKVTIRFSTLAGRTYRVEFKPGLEAPAWGARGDLAGTGGEVEFSEDLAAPVFGFYRVVLLP